MSGLADYLRQNEDAVLAALREHLELALLPVVVGLLLAVPVGALAHRYRLLRPPLLGVTSVLYAVPSLALFVVLPGILGTRILDPVNIVVALSVYTFALLVRTVVDGLGSVPPAVTAAATAVGYRRGRRLLQVELPVALPVVLAGLRVATVSNVSLVSVGALLGVGGLGELFTSGFQLDYTPPIVVGIVLSVALALLLDTAIVLAQRALTPWVRAGEAR
ncbi:ABC transporter permease [Vallicoccus soli]|uniref:ABC transporter permease subunit n=1 Tax=Vallicoccus soli TaxID=2339232 RepID=A0A3A3Z6M6_9ACTN|nr:ABC transporter permease subunit [Vallicoccus soli]RJK96355.1 ABC transporter permease subunit [Vallicoccus soli]